MKKIILLLLVSFLFMGTVFAATMYGEFEGNPIAKVMSNGKEIEVQGTPAINLNGRVMVPIYMLRELGATVTWDQESYSANVEFNNQIPKENHHDIVYSFENVKQLNNIKLIYDSNGSHISVDVYDLNEDKYVMYMNVFCFAALETDASEINFNVFSDNIKIATVTVDRTNIEKWSSKEITPSQFTGTWEIVMENTNSSYLDIPNIETSDVIESKIDGDFEGWDGDTIFKLQNGQIWQQTSFDYEYDYSFNPEVLIYKDKFGNYKMQVEGMDEEITVEQIK